MTRRKMYATLSVFVIAGLSAGFAAQRGGEPSLTAEDYIEIEQLYIAYTNAIDFGEPDGSDYAGVFTPDGIFALVIPTPIAPAGSNAQPASRCPSTHPWNAGDPEVIRGSKPDKAGLDVCIATLNGTSDLADMAEIFHQVNGTTSRHVYTNLRIMPSSEGARGFVYFNQLDVSTRPPTNTVSGIYEDTLVKTANGWRFKKRVHTHDGPYEQTSAQ